MKIDPLLIPRSAYTAIIPKGGTVGDVYKGLSFFSEPPKTVEFHRVPTQLVYVHKDPGTTLDLLIREAHQTHLSDLNFNYAIAQNKPGIFVVRGSNNKCSDSEAIRVLMLIGQDEEPSDMLKDNQKLFKGTVGLHVPKPYLQPGDQSVHVFDLIEFLSRKGFYQGRNCGTYDAFTEQAVFKMQVEFDHSDPNGIFDHQTYRLVSAR